MRYVYVVDNGDGYTIFGTIRRARAYIRSLEDYQQDRSTIGKNAEFWDNPNDLEDQQTIYTRVVR